MPCGGSRFNSSNVQGKIHRTGTSTFREFSKRRNVNQARGVRQHWKRNSFETFNQPKGGFTISQLMSRSGRGQAGFSPQRPRFENSQNVKMYVLLCQAETPAQFSGRNRSRFFSAGPGSIYDSEELAVGAQNCRGPFQTFQPFNRCATFQTFAARFRQRVPTPF